MVLPNLWKSAHAIIFFIILFIISLLNRFATHAFKSRADILVPHHLIILRRLKQQNLPPKSYRFAVNVIRDINWRLEWVTWSHDDTLDRSHPQKKIWYPRVSTQVITVARFGKNKSHGLKLKKNLSNKCEFDLGSHFCSFLILSLVFNNAFPLFRRKNHLIEPDMSLNKCVAIIFQFSPSSSSNGGNLKRAATDFRP